eukprot:TRINITY_DN496_c1_g2_i1.p1 TRINITY_DN496_c1_g2~~TRINITY_DN496_c1_g2_i1.p1  ORF type:complete len:1455 (+),score=354.03 TRINITY_DN496_c1_g2_i1:10962-15326(+)
MPTQLVTGVGLGRAPARVAGLYAAFGLLWIWLSDGALVWAGYANDHAFIASALKGTAFIAVTAAVLFWLVRREVAAARRSESLLRAVVEGTTDAVFVKDRNGRYLLANEAAARFMGRSIGAVLGRDDRELFEATDAERLMANDRAVMACGEVVTLEETLTSAGASRTYHATKAPYRDATGGIAGLIGISRDITERKIIEDTLRETDVRLREAQRIARLGSWSWEPQLDRVWWSDAEFELFGMDQQAVRPSFHTFLSLLHPDDRAIAIARVDEMMAGANEFANDLRVVRPDGASIWIHSRARATRDAAGAIIRVEGTDQDITAQRLTEMAARESEKRLQAAVEVAGLGVIVVDYDRQTADFSPRAAEQFGLPDGVPVARHEMHARFHPDDRAELQRLTELALLPTGTGSFDLEHRIIRTDGITRWLNVRKQVSFLDGHPHRAVIVTADVTDRRIAEEALRSSEARYRLLFEANPHPMWVYDVSSLRFLAVNDSAVQAYGYSRDEFLGMAIREIMADEDRSQPELVLVPLISGESRTSPWRHRRKDGTEFYADEFSHVLTDSGGNSRLVLALDVTERLQAEQARDELLARLQLQIDRMPIAYVVYDSDICYSDWNPAAEKIFGYSREEIIGQSLLLLVHPEDHAQVNAISHRLRAGDIAAQSINRNVTKDGRVITCEWHNTPLFASDGAFLGILSMTLDITDRVRAEAALRASERRLRLALEAAGAVAFMWDVKNDVVTRYFSTEPALPVTAEKVSTLNDVRAQIHHDDLSTFNTRLSACLAEGAEYRNSYRVVRPDGSTASLEEYGYLDRADDGSALSLTGMSIDVTERVEATEALRSSEARYRQLVDLLPTAIFVYSDNKIVYCNPAFLRMMGAKEPEELIGSSPFDIAHPSAHDAIRQRNALMNRAGDVFPGFEKRVVRRDGRSVPVYSVAAPISGYGRPATLVTVTDLTERERATELLRSVLSSVGDAILTIDERGVVGSANPAAVRQFGYAEYELIGKNVSVLMPEPHHENHDEYLANYHRTGVAKVIGIGREVECLRRDGTLFRADLTITEFFLEGERHFTGVLRDITERNRLQAQFIQAQKMEAIGRLAGGVAHDFNNLLTIIIGHCELLMMPDLSGSGDQRRESLANILEAGERAARLTQQLLAFSRKAVIEPKVIDLNDLVSDSANLLRRLIGEDIMLAVITAPTQIQVKADLGQLEQVVMNLVVNARDAMPTGGRLTIETATVPAPDGSPSRFARLSVSDNGHGMSDEVKGKIFEPFFTTKSVGKGTGLGLSVVHGVVSQSGGQIAIESTVGIGTTFHVLLPLVTVNTSGAAGDTMRLAAHGTETVLLVEDDQAVRTIARISLQTQGYTVLEADGGPEAIRQAETYRGEIHLLVTDVVMPEMGGRQLLDAVRQHRPALKVLFMSGYTDDAVLLHGVIEATDAFIQKPFTPLSLARKVRDVMNAPTK